MADVPQGQQGYPGQQTTTDDKSEGSMHRFAIEQILGRVNTAMLVQVKKVTNKGEVKDVGQVDVQPLAKMMDGEGGTFSHGVINDLPYFRIQGGKSAIIMDPKEGDIGVAVFADRDISSVKSTKKESNPSSYRRFDMADGLFFPCFLGGTPDNYIRFTDDGKIIAYVKGNGELFISDKYVQMKKKGDPDMHVTIDISGGQILAGKDIVIAPDPNPGD